MRQRQELIQKWKREREAKQKAEEEAKAEERARLAAKQEEEKATSDEKPPEESKAPTTEAPQLAETTKEQKPVSMDVDIKDKSAIADEESVEEKGKNWSLEDDDDDETMEVDVSEQAQSEAERSFKPLNVGGEKEDDAKDESLVSKASLTQANGKSNAAASVTNGAEDKSTQKKPKTTMIFGLGKGAMRKKNGASTAPAKKTTATAKETKQENVQEKKEESVSAMEVDGADVDPLEAYMQDVTAEARKINEEDKKRMQKFNQATQANFEREDEENAEEQNASEEEYGSDPEDILA